jgi:YggT family protein
MLNQIGILIVDTIVGFVVYLGLLRFYMQAFRAPFRNPVGQFVVALTDWGVQPLRRIVPGARGLDMASFVFAALLQAVLIGALYVLFAPEGARGPDALQWIVLVIFGLIRASLHLLIVVVIIDFVLSWVNPHTPFAPVLRAITGPFYGVFRRFIPPIGGIDLSPLFLMLVVQIVLLLVGGAERAALGMR